MDGKIRTDSHPRRWAPLLVVALVLAAGASPAETPVAEQIAEAFKLCSIAKFDDSLEIADRLNQRSDLSTNDRVGLYSVLSTIHYSMGKKHHDQAFAYLEKIREIGPCLPTLPSDFWAKPLRDQWYRALQAKDQLLCEEKPSNDIRTIAIMEFDNFSAGKYQEQLGFLTKGLSDYFEADFRALNGLKVVERDKIDFVLKEIMMSQEGMVDQDTAVRAGKLLGAQIMVFGSVMQVDSRNARMLVKAVKVETSEILATAERKGKPDFFAMEEELVKDLADKLDIAIGPEAEKALEANGSDDHDAAGLYAKGLYYVDQYDYARAYDFFKQAYDKDNTFDEAKNKMDIYRPLALSS